MRIGTGKPANQQGKKYDNGFEELLPILLANPKQWITAEDMDKRVAMSLKRSVRLSDIGGRTSVVIRKTDNPDVCTVFLRYLG